MDIHARPPPMMRVRRDQPTRLEGFVDASFAFAVTLVVISIGSVPDSVSAMVQALRGVPTFAVCFVLIARIWKRHRDWSRHYDLEDGMAVTLSLVLVFIVLIYVYPLKLMFTLMFSNLSNGMFVERAVGIADFDQLRTAYVVFGIGYASVWLVFILLYRHALRATPDLDRVERRMTRQRIRLDIAYAGIALLSIMLAATLPFAQRHSTIALPGLAYMLMLPASAWLRVRGRREIERLSLETSQ